MRAVWKFDLFFGRGFSTRLLKKSIMKKGYLIFLFLFFLSFISAQDYSIGIRAGLNYAKFLGPEETGVHESYSLSGGFHFGVNFQWNFNSYFGLRSEVLYTQVGSKYDFEGESFFVFNLVTFDRFVVRDVSDIELDISNAYVSFPITAHITVSEKFEIFGGGYINLMVSPTASGNWIFGEPGINAPDYAFDQTLIYDYNSDIAGNASGLVFNSFNPAGRFIGIIVNDQNVDLRSVVGAYYLYETLEAKKFRSTDYGLIGGFAYYLNRGLYLSGRLEYGMTDITNAAGDISYKTVNDDGSLIFNDDYDRNMNFSVSFGFKF